MSYYVSINVNCPLSELTQRTSCEVRYEPFIVHPCGRPPVEYADSCILTCKGVRYEATRNGEHLLAIIRGSNVDSLLDTLTKHFPDTDWSDEE